MKFNQLCTRGIIPMIALVFLASDAAAQRIDYAYKRATTPTGFTTSDCVIYDYAGNEVTTLRGDHIAKLGVSIRDISLNPTGSSIVILAHDKKAPVLAVFSTSEVDNALHKFNNKKEGVPAAVTYTADARKLVVAQGNKAVIYDPRTFLRIDEFELPYVPTKILISSNGYYLAITDGHKVNVLNFEGRNERKAWNFEAKVNDMDFSADNDEFAIVTDDGVINIYDTRSFLTKKAIDDAGDGLSIAYNFDGKYMAAATSPAKIEIINLLDDLDDRDSVIVDNGGMNTIDFISDSHYSTLLAYNAENAIRIKRMTKLAPYYGKLINEQLEERMNEWMKMLPGETLEQYQARVNAESREAQRKLFEAEIATSFANDLVNMATVSLGNYDRSNGVLAVEFDNMPTIFLNVPETDLGAFNNAKDLEFKNTKYGVLPNDHFEMIYSEVYNKADGKTYIFSNLDRVNLNYMTSDDNVVSLDIIQQQMMEELRLQELREKIMAEAKQSNVISDHTKITVDSRVVPDYDANGDRILNYLVNFTYEVEPEFSAVEDFGPGKYHIEESGAASAMLRIVKEAFEGDFAQYLKPGKKLLVKLYGTADATPILHGIAYDGAYGDFIDEPVYQNGRLTGMTVTQKDGIKENEQLAFIRASAVKNFLTNNVSNLNDMNTEFSHHVAVSEDKGSEFRRITAEFTFVDAF